MNDYATSNTPELARILRNYQKHPEEKVKKAFAELERRGELEGVLATLREQVKNGNIIIQSDNQKPFNNFNPSNPVTMRIGSTQQFVFEQMLIAENIPYHRQEGLDVIVPLVNYYFNDQHRRRADELEIEANTYVEKLPPSKRAKTTKKAISAIYWAFLFLGVFLVLSLLFKFLGG
jgi:hypothetical protein